MRYLHKICFLTLFVLLTHYCYAQSQNKIDSLVNLLQITKSDTQQVNLLNLLCREYWFTNPKKAMEYGKKSELFARKIKFRRGEADSYNNQGVTYRILGKFAKSLDLHLQALKLRRVIQDKKGISTSYSNIGYVYSMMKNDSTALSHYFSAIKNYSQDKYLLCVIYSNIAESYGNERKYALSLDYSKKALDLAMQIKAMRAVGNAYYQMGEIYFYKEAYSQSLYYHTKAIEILQKINNQYSINVCNIALSKDHLQAKNYQESIRCAQEALESAQKLELNVQIKNASLALSKTYQAMQDISKAFEYQSLYLQYKDSTSNQETLQQIDFFKYKYDIEKQEFKNQTLQQEKEKTIYTQRIILILIGIGLVLLLLLAIFLYNSQRKTKAINQTLKIQKKENQEKNEELAQLNEEMAQHNEYVRQKNQQLEDINKVKDRLFSIISHDFRSPLNSIQGILALLEDDTMPLTDAQEIIHKLGDKINHTLALVDNLLNWARSQMHGIEVNQQWIDIKSVVDENIQLLKSQTEKKKIHLSSLIESPQIVYADLNMMRIVIRNLIANAIKFTEVNGFIKISHEINTDFAVISVQDSGLGIPQEHLGKLFQHDGIYTTLGTANEKGTGLGLALCKDFVERNGGKIWVESEEGKGTTFTFTIPLKNEFQEYNHILR